jgi:hemoglobin/transferrin/lactoferrin receptor protein
MKFTRKHAAPRRHQAAKAADGAPAPNRAPTRLAILVAALLGSSIALAQSAALDLDLPAQPLDKALNALARQSGAQIVFVTGLAAGKQAPAVHGRLTVGEALHRLLTGSGLELSRDSAGAYILHSGPPHSLPDLSAQQIPAGKDKVLPSLVVTSKRTRDEIGKDNVYEKNVTNVYADRKQLQQIKATNPGDVFKGMNGVYSMDTRSSQAITPNIRGISGEGRTPLTIDGTEQSTNVWLHQYGAGNRSYADPALFRSIEVEKGPSLSRGVKSGVGGAVSIRTIEADDLIPEGENWGVEINLKAASNTKQPRNDPNSYYGKDYRDIPGAVRTNVNEVYFGDQNPRNKGSSNLLNSDDLSGMIAIAGRNEFTDFLASYSKREQGNYYAGKKMPAGTRGMILTTKAAPTSISPT